MAQMFNTMYDRGMAEWGSARSEADSGDLLLAGCALGRVPVQVARSSFADDVAETNLALDVEIFLEETMESNAVLDHMFSKRGMGQHAGKEEHILVFRGAGSVAATRAAKSDSRLNGTVVGEAKYLGNW